MSVVLEDSDPSELFTHLTLYGIAAICQAAGVADVRLSWTAGMRPRPVLSGDGLDDQRCGELVRDHALTHSQDSWLQLNQPAEPSRGLLSARVKPPADRSAWLVLQHARHAALDALTSTGALLDLRMVAGLGEPASWRTRRGDSLPDEGASRLEMQPRNQGSEIVGTRLRPLAQAVGRRSPDQVLDGLLGRCVVDDLGKGRSDSRGAVNLRPLGPTDSAQAWAALWGLSQTAVAHLVERSSRTAGHLPRAGDAGPRAGAFAVAVWHGAWRLPRLRAVLRSRQLYTVGGAFVAGQAAPVDSAGWLTSRGASAVYTYPIGTFGSASAPERRALVLQPHLW